MGFVELLIIVFIIVILTAGFVWAINYFAPSQVPTYVSRLLWGVAIFLILYVILSALGLTHFDITIPKLR